MWAFDSFQGLPAPVGVEDWHPQWKRGNLRTSLEEFHKICQRNRIPRSTYHVVSGFFQESLTGRDEPSNISLAYVDCDMYSSAEAVLRFLKPRLKHGMILAFDDYFCWSKDEQSGERKACGEMFRDESRFILAMITRHETLGKREMDWPDASI
jgi:O-methyltransferase